MNRFIPGKTLLGFGLVLFLSLAPARAAPRLRPPKVLIVVAHPDDESCFAATVFRIARELGGTVDQLVITDGQAGFKYSFPAQFIYGKKLTDEKTGRRELPAIRRGELLRAGAIIGIRKHYFLGQTDFGYTTDPSEAFKKWDLKKINSALSGVLMAGNYDLVLTLLPTAKTHGHHKAAAILVLDAVARLPLARRPLVLGCSEHNTRQAEPAFAGLDGYPETRVQPGVSLPPFDRDASFGYRNRLNYHVFVSWMMAEHKSQGLLAMDIGSQKRYEALQLFQTQVPDASRRALEWMKEILPSETEPSGRLTSNR